MRVLVLGATGEMGGLVAELLRERGHEVMPASRATGVDAVTGEGLDSCLAGADALVDCLNRDALTRRAAMAFFPVSAEHVLSAAKRQGVGHLVLLSIVGVTAQEARRAIGYYAGKAAQEDRYLASGMPVTVVATTGWFTLAEKFLTQITLGSMALIPPTLLQPVHPAAAAAALVDAVEAGPGVTRVELAGPERLRADEMARRLASTRGEAVRVLRVPFPSRAFREGAMLPAPTARIDDRTYAAWLDSLRPNLD